MEYVFLFKGRPSSSNKRLGGAAAQLKDRVREAIESQINSPMVVPGQLTGIARVYFNRYNSFVHPDIDNMSKPIWDAVQHCGIPLFKDDRDIRVRYAAVIEYGESPFLVAPDYLSEEQRFAFLRLAESGENFTVVQLKSVTSEHFEFN